MGKNVAVFVDVANIFYAAKAAGVDIDYVTLLKSASAGRDLVRAYAYTGLDPDNENQRNFHDFLRRHGYKVVSKDIRKYGDGKVKANLDIELVVDMMKTARNLDIAIVVSGDGDFAPAIRAVQEMGVRCEVISFRGNTSSDLIEVADLFTDITQLARVEKGSRSGRRVADDDADLSMTEVPDKQTEGTGAGRGRGRGRGRGGRDVEPISMGGRSTSSGRGRGRPTAATGSNGTETAASGSRPVRGGGGLTEADLANAEVFTLDSLEDDDATIGTDLPIDREDDGAEGPRRRRRRGGRGRGRGRGRDEAGEGTEVAEGDDALEGIEPVVSAESTPAPAPRAGRTVRPAASQRPLLVDDEDEDEEVPVAPRGPRSTPFGSVWDSQLGTTPPPTANLGPIADDEDFDEPEIPEYLIAERNRNAGARGGAGRGAGRGGPRGGRAAYQSAIERERYGRGGGGGGINRYPDVSGRNRQDAPREDRSYSRSRDDRPPRDDRPRPVAAPSRGTSSEPWSEVPPELEAMLRAQVAGKAPETGGRVTEAVQVAPDEDPTAVVELGADAAVEPTAKRRTTRKPKADEAVTATADADAGSDAKPAARRRTTRTSTSVAEAPEAAADAEAAPAPKRRTTRKTAATADAEASASSDGADATDADASAKPAPKRRAPRKTTAAESA